MTYLEIVLNILLIGINFYFIRENVIKNSVVVALTSPIYISLLSIYFSLLIIEYGAYVSEQSIYGFPNFASVYLLLYIFILNIVVHREKTLSKVITKFKENRNFYEYNNSQSKGILYSFVLFTITNYYIIYILGYGVGQNRFNPYGSYDYKEVFFKISILYSTLLPLFIIRINNKFKVSLILVILINSLIVMSTTSSFIQFIMPFGILVVLNKKYFQFNSLRKKYVRRYAILIIILIICGLIIKYLSLNNKDILTLYYRYVVQGQLFWGSINHPAEADLVYQFHNYLKHIAELKGFNISLDYGFGYLMRFISGDIAVRYIEVFGVRMTSGMPAILIVNFGIILSFLIYIVILKLFILFMKFYLNSLLYERIILFVILSFIYSNVSDFILMGEYGHFNLLFLSYILLYTILRFTFNIRYHSKPKLISMNNL